MNEKSWVAMTGLWVLMATSAAQAHLIPICVEAYESGTEVSGAVEGVTGSHVTFTQAGGPSSAAPGVGTKASAWQKANDKTVPFWRASSSPIGNCVQRDLSYSHAQGRQPLVADGVGPEAVVRLAPAAAVLHAQDEQPQVRAGIGAEAGGRLVPDAAVLMDASANAPTDFVPFDATGQAYGPWGWAFNSAGNSWALAPANTFNQVLAQQSSAAGAIGILPVQTSNQAPGQPPIVPNSTGQNSDGNNNANNNGNISEPPAEGRDGHSNIDGSGGNGPVTEVTEPESLALLMVGLLGVAVTSRGRRKLAVTG